MKTTKEQREEYKRHMEWLAHRHDRHTANKYFLAILDDLEAAEAEVQRLQSAISWALGEGDDFPLRTEDDGPFYWRRELRQRARGKTQPPQSQESESE